LFTSPASNVTAISTNDDIPCQVEITLDPDFPIEERQISPADTDHPMSNETRLFDQWEPTDGVITDEIKLNKGTKPGELAIHPVDSRPGDVPAGKENHPMLRGQ
jgi:hypothetical protein